MPLITSRPQLRIYVNFAIAFSCAWICSDPFDPELMYATQCDVLAIAPFFYDRLYNVRKLFGIYSRSRNPLRFTLSTSREESDVSMAPGKTHCSAGTLNTISLCYSRETI